LLARIERLERRLGIEGDGDAQPAALVPAPVEQPSRQPPRAEVEKAHPERVAPKKQPPGQSHSGGPDTESQTEVPSAAEVPPGETPDAAGTLVSLSQIRETWNATMHEVSRRSKRVWGLLSPSRPVRFENDVLVVEVQSEWHRDEMGRRDGGGGRSTNHEILAEALHSALGIRPHIEFRTRGQPPTPAGDDALEPSEAGSADPAGISIADVRDATNLADPVELVKQGLGGEVVEQRTGEAPRRAR
jgi:DNA polymerase-3 subunit gamma/tau